MSSTSVHSQPPSDQSRQQPDVNGNQNQDDNTPPNGDTTYPEQKHAGAVGYGPNYGKGADAMDQFTGIGQEIKGKILHKPELVQHGKDLRTGELKRREKQNQDEMDPFATAGGDEDDKQSEEASKSDTNANTSQPPGATAARRRSEKGAKE